MGEFYGKAVRYATSRIVADPKTGEQKGEMIEVDALVFQEHSRLESHLGGGGEPLVHLFVADPAKENLNLADPMLKAQIAHDVAHASHVFNDEEVTERKRLSKPLEYEGGRWSEMGTSPLKIWEETRKAFAVKYAPKPAEPATPTVDDEIKALEAKIADGEKAQKLEELRKKAAAMGAEKPKETVQ